VNVSEHRRGLVYGVAAYLMWGLFPLYWPLLAPAQAAEILAHRIVWSLAFLVLLLWRRVGFGWVRRLPARKLSLLAVAAVVVAVNWGTYIWAVTHQHVIETALGYFINPIVTVLIGVFVLRERLHPMQWLAVAIAAVAVLVLTAAYGHLPWIALILAGSFASYGLAKKQAAVGALEGLGVETALLFGPALGYLVYLSAQGAATFGHVARATDALLVGSGVMTAIPLLCFGAAANRIPLTTIGLLQYLAPSLQFLCGVLVFHESMPASRWLGFGLVWCALVVLALYGVGLERLSAIAPWLRARPSSSRSRYARPDG
jgi:chloramphenicol-sensitive protein RarD